MNLYWEVCCVERGKVKHQRVLWLTLLTSAMSIITNQFCFEAIMFCLLFECVASGIVQTANTVPKLIKLIKTHFVVTRA